MFDPFAVLGALFKVGSAISSKILTEDSIAAKRDMLRQGYKASIDKLHREALNYKQSLRDTAGYRGFDPSSAAITSAMTEADTLTAQIEQNETSTLTQQFDDLSNQRTKWWAETLGDFGTYFGSTDFMSKGKSGDKKGASK
ncbi:MAG: hypothetical protein ACRCX2_10545 [Paraclostridium sp.]